MLALRFHATFRPIVGGRDATLPWPPEGGTASVRALLREIVARWPAFEGQLATPDGELVRHVNLFVDGRSVRWLPEGLDTVVSTARRIELFPPVAGG